MIFEFVTTTLMGAVATTAFIKKNGIAVNEAGKIQRIFSLTGLNVKDGKDTLTTQLISAKQYDWGVEYKFRIPLGRSFNDYVAKLDVLQDGINNRRKRISLTDLKALDFDGNIIGQIKTLWSKKLTEQKEIELDYDGLLIVRVYDNPLPNKIEWSEQFIKMNSWKVPIGITRNREIIYHDFDKSKHLIIAGATGYGKSAILKLIVTSLILQQHSNTELTLIDLKGGSAFHRFRNCEQVKYYARSPEMAREVLFKVQGDMNQSFENVVNLGFEDVKEAGIKKRHFVVIDEAGDLADDKIAMSIITDIARRGRSAGYYLVFCTQYPTAEVIPSQTKRNIIARLCYVVDTETASRVVLDEGGADKLPDIAGRGIYKNGVKRYTVQSPYIPNQQINELIKPHIEEVQHDNQAPSNTERRGHIVTFEEV